MFRFADPHAFQLFWLLPVFWGIYFLTRYRANLRMRTSFGEKLTPVLTASVSNRKRFLKSFLVCSVVIAMILAWARPQAGQSTQEIKSAGVELMFLVDVSESMMAEDLKPNRLEQAKIELGRIIDRLPGHKIGIIAFAGSAALLSPLTNDPNALKMYLDSLSPLSVSSQGTDFGKALQEAEAAFERGGQGEDPAARVTRVIVIASDGEDQEQGALDAAKKLTEKGIRIFSLAYGTEAGAPIPQRDSLGFLKGYKKDRSGQEIMTKVKGDALKALADAGKGSFYHAAFGGTHVNEIVEDINHLDKTEFENQMVTQYDERFPIFLWIALVLGSAELLLGERYRRGRLWRGRFEVRGS